MTVVAPHQICGMTVVAPHQICGMTVVAPHHNTQSKHFHRKICRKTSTQKSAFGSTIEPAISEVQIQVLVKSNVKAEGHGCLLLLLLLYNKKLMKE